jgi:transcriptional regulator with XRE-family HTH domain
MPVGSKIRALAKEKKISIAEIARKLGISGPALFQRIDGNPTLSTLEEIAQALDTTVEAIFRSDNLSIPSGENGPLAEIIQIVTGLSQERRLKVLEYARDQEKIKNSL